MKIFGLCCGGGLICLLVCGVFLFGGSTLILSDIAVAADKSSSGCAKTGCDKLGGNYCAKYQACSVDRNLMNASGEELARYQEEVAMDGVSFSDRIAPDFTLPTTKGQQVSLSGMRGKNVAVVFLSAHCFHSMDTLPILAELQKEYDNQNLTILPVFVNSGDVEDVASRAWELKIETPILVSEGKDLSIKYDSRMVPSTFLIDEQGNLTKKFVGFKNKTTLVQAFDELVGS